MSMTSSETFVALIKSLKRDGCVFEGSDAQLGALIQNALEVISPDTNAASHDAENMAYAFEAIVEILTDGEGADAYEDDEGE